MTLPCRVLGALVGLALIASLTACSLFATRRPPGSVSDAAAILDHALRATVGTSDVRVTVAPRDERDGGSLDRPGAWLITASVAAGSAHIDPHSVAAALERGLESARRAAPATGTLWLIGRKLAPASIDFASSGASPAVARLVDAAVRLRALPGIEGVHVHLHGAPPSIAVGSAATWVTDARELRSVTGFGNAPLDAVTMYSPEGGDGGPERGSVALDATAPNDATIAGLARLVAVPGVTSLSYDAIRPREPLAGWRPSLTIGIREASARAAVLRRLTGFDSEAAAVGGMPRASYRVYSPGDFGSETDGYLGLPPGAVAPMDLGPAAVRMPAPTDPAAEAASRAANLNLVRTALQDAGTAAGIGGTPSIAQEPCATGAGSQVYGSVVIPIFRVTDTADKAYSAIVTAWIHEGYRAVDHAAGTELRAGGPLEQLTIRGTSDGLVITATSRC